MTHEEKIHELLSIIESSPGLTAGQMLARTTAVNSNSFKPTISDMTRRGLVVTTGMKENTAYHITDTGRDVMAGAEMPTARTVYTEADPTADIPTIGKGAVVAGVDEVILEEVVFEQPLKVIDSDLSSLDEALSELAELRAKVEQPANVQDLIAFNRKGAEQMRAYAPVAAALMESTAAALERAYCQQ